MRPVVGFANLLAAGFCSGMGVAAAMHGNLIGVAVNAALAAMNIGLAILNLHKARSAAEGAP